MPKKAKPIEYYIRIKGEDECWPWLGGVTGAGYGAFGSSNKKISAHVAMYIKHKGPIPIGLEIGHTCFNALCVNPKHLEAMTHTKNIRQRNNVKLNDEKVLLIKDEYKNTKITQKELAIKYNINQSSICRILSGERW